MGVLDSVNVVGPWASVSEPVEWIVGRVDALVQCLSEELGASGWELTLPSPMTDDPETWNQASVPWQGDKAALVEQCPSSKTLATDKVHTGYSLHLHARTKSQGQASVHFYAGSAVLGRHVPAHSVHFEVSAARGERVAEGVADALVRAAVDIVNPLKATETKYELGSLARRGGWMIGPAYRLWLRDDVLSSAVLPVGMSAHRVGAGWLYVVPDEWPAERVVEVHEEFREVNGIDVLPH